MKSKSDFLDRISYIIARHIQENISATVVLRTEDDFEKIAEKLINLGVPFINEYDRFRVRDKNVVVNLLEIKDCSSYNCLSENVILSENPTDYLDVLHDYRILENKIKKLKETHPITILH